MTVTTNHNPTKIYTDRAILSGTFLGGPLVAGYLFAENFKAIDEPEKVTATWVITIIVTIGIFGGIFLVPENINIPRLIIPITYTAIAFGLFKKYQEEKVNTYIEEGAEPYRWWRVFAISIIGLLITVLPIFGIAYTAETINQANISTKTYGLTVKHEIDFDKTNISDQEIDEIADGFIDAGFFDLSVAKYIHVVKNESTYEIYIAVVKGIENDPEGLQYFIDLRNQLDSYLITKDIEFKLAVDYLENVVKVLK